MAIEMTGGRSYLLKEASLTEDNSKKIQLYLYVVESASESDYYETILNLGLYIKTSPIDCIVGPWTALDTDSSNLAGEYFSGSIPECSGIYWLISNVTKTVLHDRYLGTAVTYIPWNWDINLPFININQPSGNKELVLSSKNRIYYNIFFDSSGGSFNLRAVHKYQGDSVTLPYEIPTKEGFNFVGWGLTPDTKEAAYYPEDVYTADESVTLYAIWEPKTYTIRFDACGGSVDCYTKSKTHGDSIALPGLIAGTTKPIKLGYNFIGWSTLADTSSHDYVKDGDLYSIDKSATLYAIWEDITYTIQYDDNGGTNAPKTQIKTYGEDISLATEEPIRQGYTFQGWAISSDSSEVYYRPGQIYDINASLCLYAIWEDITYTIQYDANGGTNAPKTQIKTYGEDITISSIIPVNPKYQFEGWTLIPGDTKIYYSAGDVYSNNSSVILYAIWNSDITYDIKYYDYRAAAELPYSLKLPGVALALSNSTPSRDGCIFEGWTCDSESTEVLYRLGDTYTEDKSVTLYPVRSKKIILRYFGNGGSEGPSDQIATIIFNDAQLEDFSATFEISETIPKRPGYTFENWITSTSSVYKAKDLIECLNDTSLFAQWAPISYTLTIDPNGGYRTSKATEAFTISTRCGETFKIESLQREGYKLVGFTLNPSASVDPSIDTGTDITFDNAAQTFIYTQGYYDMTANAQWEINTYDIVFDANGGTGAPEPQVKIHGEVLQLSKLKPIKENYVFSGWSPSPSNTSIKYCYSRESSTYNYDVDKPATLYAIWEPKTYRVEYALSNYSGYRPVFMVNKKIHGQDFILSLNRAIPDREKYEFFGWSTSPEAATVVYEPNEAYTVDADITLYTVFRYLIHYDFNGGHLLSSDTSTSRDMFKLPDRAFAITDYFDNNDKVVREGYTFKGWRDTAGNTHLSGESYKINSPLDLKAIWAPDETAVKCYIQLDPNGGTWDGVKLDTTHLIDETINGVRQIKQKVYYHKGLDIYSDVITPYKPISSSGEIFVGWNTKADGKGYWYGAKLSHDIIASTTLFAQWASSSNTPWQLSAPTIQSVKQVENMNTIEVNCAARYNGTINGFYALAFEIYAADPVLNLGVFEVLIASGIVYKVLPGDTLYSDYSFQIHLGDNLADYIKSLFSSKGGSLGFKYQVTLQSLGTAGAKYNSPIVTYGSRVDSLPSFAYCRKPESPFNIKITDFDLSKSSSSHPLTLSYMPSTLRLSEVNYDFRKAYVNERLSQGACYIRVTDITDGSVILEDPIEVSDSGAYFNLEECLDSAGKSFEFGHVYSFTAENRVRYQASLSSNTVVSKSVEVSSDQIVLGYIKLEEKIQFDSFTPTITSINTLPMTRKRVNGEDIPVLFSSSKKTSGPNYDIKISWPVATSASADNKLKHYRLQLSLLSKDASTHVARTTVELQENIYFLNLENTFGRLPAEMYILVFEVTAVSVYGTVDYNRSEIATAYIIHGINCPYIEIPGEPIKRKAIAYVKVPDPENSEATQWMLASDYLIKEKNQGWKSSYSDYEMLVDENNEIILDEDDMPIYTF